MMKGMLDASLRRLNASDADNSKSSAEDSHPPDRSGYSTPQEARGQDSARTHWGFLALITSWGFLALITSSNLMSAHVSSHSWARFPCTPVRAQEEKD